MQIINVSLAKANESVMPLKFPDKQQNSLKTLTFQSKRNSDIPGDFWAFCGVQMTMRNPTEAYLLQQCPTKSKSRAYSDKLTTVECTLMFC